MRIADDGLFSPDRPELRASDADREAAAYRLKEAAGEGRITLDELDERLAVVLAARTFGDLSPALADLPLQRPIPTEPDRLVIRRGWAQGYISRQGVWPIPPRLLLDSRYGFARLDFTQAVLTSAVVELVVCEHNGYTRIVVPDGSTVDVTSLELLGAHLRNRARSAARPSPGVPHFQLTGRQRTGGISIRYPGRRERRRLTPAPAIIRGQAALRS